MCGCVHATCMKFLHFVYDSIGYNTSSTCPETRSLVQSTATV